jgi:1-aminocyclopropane-1-carboxylate deaminase
MHLPFSLDLPSPLQQVPGLTGKEYQCWVKRDDLIHAVISGNKWRKLAAHFAHPLPSKMTSFGGGHSNHLHALGYACRQLQIPFRAIIRGDYSQHPTPCICDLLAWGAEIEYVTKVQFREYRETPAIAEQEGLVIPEGGFSHHALSGVAQIVTELHQQLGALNAEPITLICPVATGTTLAGLIKAAPAHWHVVGIAVLKGKGYLEDNVQALLPNSFDSAHRASWHIEHGYHAGGYAKASDTLTTFVAHWSEAYFPIEPVYSGKAVWALANLLKSQKIKTKKIIYLHTGGLQGARKIGNSELIS